MYNQSSHWARKVSASSINCFGGYSPFFHSLFKILLSQVKASYLAVMTESRGRRMVAVLVACAPRLGPGLSELSVPSQGTADGPAP